ncbi:MAG: PLP-dependent aminotransferase family protein [Acidiferrobacterales bacterium]|nr:PLP-dependent aminotransferase family protein [Acidiferrobacterales bacterium]
MIAPARHVAHLKPSFIREILTAAVRPDVISLAGGLPAESCFPLQLFEKSLNTLVDEPGLFQYGATRGYAPLLEHVDRNLRVSTDHRVLVCNGSQQALDLVARAFINPGDAVVMETPGYLGALQIFNLAQARLVPVAQEADGPDIGKLESVFEKKSVKFFYAVPDFHNPTGVTWSLEKRSRVAELCDRYGVILIEDAPYRDIRFSGIQQPMVSTLCPENSIVLRSFSKSICPGMRLGIAMANPSVIDTMVKVKQAADLHTSTLMQKVLLDILMDDHFPSHLHRVCDEYRRRYQALCSALCSISGSELHYQNVEGGMFIWIHIGTKNAVDVSRRAMKRNLAVVPGDVFYPHHSKGGHYLRLNFSHTNTDLFSEAVQRLRASL